MVNQIFGNDDTYIPLRDIPTQNFITLVMTQTVNKIPAWNVIAVLLLPVGYWINACMPWSRHLFINSDSAYWMQWVASIMALQWLSVLLIVLFLKRQKPTFERRGLPGAHIQGYTFHCVVLFPRICYLLFVRAGAARRLVRQLHEANQPAGTIRAYLKIYFNFISHRHIFIELNNSYNEKIHFSFSL